MLIELPQAYCYANVGVRTFKNLLLHKIWQNISELQFQGIFSPFFLIYGKLTHSYSTVIKDLYTAQTTAWQSARRD
jgi:hypothetical protein